MVTPAGPLAMIDCEPRQARKGATVVVISCAEVWLAGEATRFIPIFVFHFHPKIFYPVFLLFFVCLSGA